MQKLVVKKSQVEQRLTERNQAIREEAVARENLRKLTEESELLKESLASIRFQIEDGGNTINKQNLLIIDNHKTIIAQKEEIERNTPLLESLRRDIDKQIELNRKKEEEALKEIKALNELEKSKLLILQKDVKNEAKKKETILLEVKKLLAEIQVANIEAEKMHNRMIDNDNRIKSADAGLVNRLHYLNDREKEMNVYRKRLERWCKKFNLQFKI